MEVVLMTEMMCRVNDAKDTTAAAAADVRSGVDGLDGQPIDQLVDRPVPVG